MIEVVNQSYPGHPGLDTGISRAIVEAVGQGQLPETFRIHTTERIVAFGRQDRVTPDYTGAVSAARERGYLPVERLAGGRAAVFHEGTLAFSWAIPAADPRLDITARFTTISELLAGAFRDLGADARVGELAGEYCPGAYSVNIGGRSKVMGVGQRLVRGAAHVGGVIVVDGGRRIAEVLGPVYARLGLSWDPRTAGDLCDHVPEVTFDTVTGAVLARLGTLDATRASALPDWILAAGRRLAPSHVAPDAGTS